MRLPGFLALEDLLGRDGVPRTGPEPVPGVPGPPAFLQG